MPDPKKKIMVKVAKKTNVEAEEAKKGIYDKETVADAKAEGYVNRNPVVTTTVKGKDDKGSYTDTHNSQDDDTYKGTPSSERPKHTTNAWFNGLSQAQKDAHNKAVREKEAKELAAAKPDVIVPGNKSTNRVYDPAPTTVPKKKVMVRKWTREEVKQPFGGHTSSGTTTDDKIVEKGYAKNKIDITNTASKNNTYEARDFTDKETKLWNRGRLSESDNPIGKDTIGRGAKLDKQIELLDKYDAKKGKKK